MDLKVLDGLKHPFYFRDGTSDSAIIRGVMIDKREYNLPGIDPKVILDIGANIGVVAVMMANRYPDAHIYCFEPEVENFRILCMNTGPYTNITACNVGLGAETETLRLYDSDDANNFGGYSTKSLGVNPAKYREVQIIRARAAILAMTKKVDLIKIDCEGAEYEIFQDIADLLPGVDAIMGEAHGINDFLMFDLLQPYFDLSIFKPMTKRNYEFYAKNRRLSGTAP